MDGRMCKGASRRRQTQRASFGHKQELSARKAQTSLAYTQPIQEVVGHGSKVRGYSLVVGRGKTYSGIPAQALLGEMSYWDDIPPKRSKDELEPLDACYKG